MRQAERIWLSPVAEPLPIRMRREGWRPDDPGDYCGRCGEAVGPHEADEFGCSACRSVNWPWARFVRLGAYEAPLAGWIAEVKFSRWRAMGRSLGRELGVALRNAGAAEIEPERWVVVSVPTTWRRRMARGIDHARFLAEGVARELDVPLERPLRARHRASQRSVPAGARARNAAGRFGLRPGARLAGRHVILVDDVRTSGGTMAAATRALLGRSRRRGERTTGRGAAAVWAACVAVASDRTGFSGRVSAGR